MMNIDEILADLQSQLQTLEDAKTAITELQEETRGLIAGVNAWFALHENELPEVK
ncbi:MAG: hypothetical protein J6S83_11975 [Lachnospiraceae bacterium]|nr:hypothetical protein [Lachnospiraceae bacterium]